MKFEIAHFYPIIDSALLVQAGVEPLEMARALAAAGAKMVQFRHKGEYTRQAFELARAIGRVVQQAGARYIINDRADVALMLGADGVHLGQDDLPPAAARKVVGERLIVGFSTHNEEQLRGGDCEPVDYLAIGPIFDTASKVNPDPTVGLEELRRLRPLTQKPLVAIGGITRQHAAEVLSAGANSVAVISDLVAEDLTECAREWVRLAG